MFSPEEEASQYLEDREDAMEAYSVASDDLEDRGIGEEEDAEAEAFTFVELAWQFAKNAVQAGLELEVAEDEAAAEEQEEPQKPWLSVEEDAASAIESLHQSTRSTAATESPMAAEEPAAPPAPWHLRPSVGGWLRPAKALPLLAAAAREAPQPGAAAALPEAAASPASSPAVHLSPVPPSRDSVKCSRRRVIGGIVRPQIDTSHLRTAEAVPPAACSPPASPTSPTSPLGELAALRGGSVAGSLRHARRSSVERAAQAQRVPPMSYRMDMGDAHAPSWGGVAPKRPQRESSLTNTYEALGAEVYNLDKGGFDAAPPAPRQPEASPPSRSSKREPRMGARAKMASALAWELGEPSAPCMVPTSPPPSSAGQRRPKQTHHVATACSAMAMDLGEEASVKVPFRPAGPPPSRERSSRSSPASAGRTLVNKQPPSFLPSLTAQPNKSVEWSMSMARPARKWAEASPVF